MSETKSFMSPVAGNENALRSLAGLSADPVEILARQEMESEAVDIRYAPQAWLSAFKELSDEVGPSTVLAIGQQIGRFGFIELGGNRAKLVCASTSACEYDQRLIADMAQKRAAKPRTAVISHDPTQPCRQKGGASCTYLVSW